MRAGHWVPISVVVVILAIAVARVASLQSDDLQPQTGIAAPAADDGASTSTSDWSGGEENADRHWRKHGRQFPQFSNEGEFVAGARQFLAHPPPGTLTKLRANGDTLYYDPKSGTFAVQAADGAPRTLFKPDDGMAYWERQH